MEDKKDLTWFEERLSREREICSTFNTIYGKYQKRLSEIGSQDFVDEREAFEKAKARELLERDLIEMMKSYQVKDFIEFLKTA